MRTRVVLGAVALAVMVSAGTAWASTPPAGTAAQVAGLVAASHKITKLNKTVQVELETAYADLPAKTYPNVKDSCNAVTSCVFGDTTSKKVVVLFGDSHAMMWVLPIAQAAKAAHLKLILLWTASCPLAQITGFTYVGTYSTDNPACASWRAKEITTIHGLDPSIVLLSERTGGIVTAPGAKTYPSAKWKAGLVKTIDALKSKGTRIAVFEDLTYFDTYVPSCLASYPSAVQKCGVPSPNPKYPGQQAAEKAAATATGSRFITTHQWFCTKTCSPVIGNYITYYDQGHVSATYSLYLRSVLAKALAPVFK